MIVPAERPAFINAWPSFSVALAITAVFALLPVTAAHIAGQQNTNRFAYIQSFRLADVPLGPKRYFAISTPGGQVLQDNADDIVEVSLAEGNSVTDTSADPRQGLPRQSRPSETAFVLLEGRRLLNVDYDLGIQGAQSGDLEVNKAVNVNGRPAGVLNVSIDQNSQLHLSSTDLSQLLPDELYSRLDVVGGYVAFDTLRTSGIDISYDPVRDTLAINL